MVSSWIGITDHLKDGHFAWVGWMPGQTFTHWETGQPNGGGNEHCGQLIGHNGRWNVASCDLKASFICQRDNQTKNG